MFKFLSTILYSTLVEMIFVMAFRYPLLGPRVYSRSFLLSHNDNTENSYSNISIKTLLTPVIYSKQILFGYGNSEVLSSCDESCSFEDDQENKFKNKLLKGLNKIEPSELIRKKKVRNEKTGTYSYENNDNSDSNSSANEEKNDEDQDSEYEIVDKFRFRIDGDALRNAVQQKTALKGRQIIGNKIHFNKVETNSLEGQDDSSNDLDANIYDINKSDCGNSDINSNTDNDGNSNDDNIIFDQLLLDKISRGEAVIDDSGEDTIIRFVLDDDEFDSMINSEENNTVKKGNNNGVNNIRDDYNYGDNGGEEYIYSSNTKYNNYKEKIDIQKSLQYSFEKMKNAENFINKNDISFDEKSSKNKIQIKHEEEISPKNGKTNQSVRSNKENESKKENENRQENQKENQKELRNTISDGQKGFNERMKIFEENNSCDSDSDYELDKDTNNDSYENDNNYNIDRNGSNNNHNNNSHKNNDDNIIHDNNNSNKFDKINERKKSSPHQYLSDISREIIAENVYGTAVIGMILIIAIFTFDCISKLTVDIMQKFMQKISEVIKDNVVLNSGIDSKVMKLNNYSKPYALLVLIFCNLFLSFLKHYKQKNRFAGIGYMDGVNVIKIERKNILESTSMIVKKWIYKMIPPRKEKQRIF